MSDPKPSDSFLPSPPNVSEDRARIRAALKVARELAHRMSDASSHQTEAYAARSGLQDIIRILDDGSKTQC